MYIYELLGNAVMYFLYQVQQDAGCIVGKDYPARMNDHKVSAKQCNDHMAVIRKQMVDQRMFVYFIFVFCG